MSEAEKRRCEEIIEIQRLLSEGYAPVQVKDMLQTTYFRIRRYATGDPHKLCRYPAKESEAEQYREEIIELLNQNVPYNLALFKISALGYQGKRSAFENYCRSLISELNIPYSPRRNTVGAPIHTHNPRPKCHYVSSKDVLHYIWSSNGLNPADLEYILGRYPCVSAIIDCVADFRAVYNNKNPDLLDTFIDKYSASDVKSIKSFASGLRGDLNAVKNSVTSHHNNGFVEGNNNKIKVIKRVMYGRAKIDLLRVKIIFAR